MRFRMIGRMQRKTPTHQQYLSGGLDGDTNVSPICLPELT